jgi:TnpA family transposase
LPDLSWVPDQWRRAVLIKGQDPSQVDRRYFELCVFYHLMSGLKSGDICITGSDKYSDHRAQLITWDEYHQMIEQYGHQVSLPVEKNSFIRHTREWLESIASSVDDSFPLNEYVKIEGGYPVVKKLARQPEPKGLRELEAIIAQRMEPVTILEVLNNTQRWLAWDKSFGPLSGFDTKLNDPSKSYLLAAFCYGCNLGPSQTARSIKDVGRFQLAWVNQRHVTEEKLNDAIVKLINAYDLFDLPKFWGTGKSASVDGTKWDMYEQNLLSEYHIRYGGYGGIGYYHVSDKYIALFSHFIPCGVHEAVYLLDGLFDTKSDIQPDTIHGDTHAQSETVFGLSYLLGIKLMPRIRSWKYLDLYRNRKETIYAHINELFSDEVNWDLIEKYLPDMLRVALSIKLGRITASTILRKLGSNSRKNKLYQAFRELGRVVRTGFLLKYLSDKELREIIHAATCKSETFNRFAQWLMFGSEGIIAENNRDEQRKVIKYNHLVANCVSFYNVSGITAILNDLAKENYPISKETLASLSPFITSHLNRFGDYPLDFDMEIPSLTYSLMSLTD